MKTRTCLPLLPLFLHTSLAGASCGWKKSFPQPNSSLIEWTASDESVCEWRLQADPSLAVSVSFEAFDLPPVSVRSGQCLHAYVQLVWIDRGGREHVSARLCGHSIPRPSHTLQHTLRIIARIDTPHTHAHFKLRYNIQREESMVEESSCGGMEVRGQGVSGVLRSPSWPLSFPPNASCEWLLRVPANHLIFLRAIFIHITPSFEECSRARLSIVDGYSMPSYHSDAISLCGPHTNYVDENSIALLSSSNRLLIKLRTDGSERMAEDRYSFSLAWTSVQGIWEGSNSSCPSHSCTTLICIESHQAMCSRRGRMCVEDSLVCNGVADCGVWESSDERACALHSILSALSAAAALLLFLPPLIMCVEHARRREKARSLAASHSFAY